MRRFVLHKSVENRWSLQHNDVIVERMNVKSINLEISQLQEL
jgi:hypothetical protein